MNKAPDKDIVTTSSPNMGALQKDTARVVQEVQAMVVLAKQFPRDETRAYKKMIEACKRPKLAEMAVYSYPRGDTVVSGPSIRLAEEIVRCWGNMVTDVTEVNQDAVKGTSEMVAYCWDLESNVRHSKTFTVRHVRTSKSRGTYALSDPRDVYEATANFSQRRLRAVILAGIPDYIVDDLVEQCKRTLANMDDVPLGDRIKRAVVLFSSLGVTEDMLEKRLGHALSETTIDEVVELIGVYNALKDNNGRIDDFFERKQKAEEKPEGNSKAEDLAKRNLQEEQDGSTPTNDTANEAGNNQDAEETQVEPEQTIDKEQLVAKKVVEKSPQDGREETDAESHEETQRDDNGENDTAHQHAADNGVHGNHPDTIHPEILKTFGQDVGFSFWNGKTIHFADSAVEKKFKSALAASKFLKRHLDSIDDFDDRFIIVDLNMGLLNALLHEGQMGMYTSIMELVGGDNNA